VTRNPFLALAVDAAVASAVYTHIAVERATQAVVKYGKDFRQSWLDGKARGLHDLDTPLAKAEAAEECYEPDELWQLPDYAWPQGMPGVNRHAGVRSNDSSCNRTNCTGSCAGCIAQSKTSKRSSVNGSPRKNAAEEPRVATGSPLGTPGRVDSESPPVSPSPSGQSLPNPPGDSDAWRTDWLMGCAELDVLMGSEAWRPVAAAALRDLAESIDPQEVNG
jgi:hypothetical protein